jgi:Na+/H+ antiporter NhaD/arsenite permease-like protein
MWDGSSKPQFNLFSFLDFARCGLEDILILAFLVLCLVPVDLPAWFSSVSITVQSDVDLVSMFYLSFFCQSYQFFEFCKRRIQKKRSELCIFRMATFDAFI